MSHSDPPKFELERLTSFANHLEECRLYAEAAELLRLALRLDPSNLAVRHRLERIQRLDTAQRGPGVRDRWSALRKKLRRDAIDAAHFLGLAYLYSDRGEIGRALECLEISKAKDLAHPSQHKLHGKILLRGKDFEEAARELYQALRFNPFDREIAELLGEVEYERKRFKAALEVAIHAFLLEEDREAEPARRLLLRIKTLKQILGWDKATLLALFRERWEILNTAFDRLEWRRERFLEEQASDGAHPEPWEMELREHGSGQIGLAMRLRRLELWAHMTDEQLFQLTRALREERHPKGKVLFRDGSRGTDFFILEAGEIEIRRPTPYGTFRLTVVEPGDLFGEVSFLSRAERTGEAVVSQDARLFRFDAEELAHLMEQQPDLAVQLYWSLWHGLSRKLRATNAQLNTFFASDARPENFIRLRHGKTVAAVRTDVSSRDKIRLFREQGLSGRELATLATFSQVRKYERDDRLFVEGDEGHELYVILEGRVLISKMIPGAGEEALAILERGDFFGEMSLIDGQPRSADARAYEGALTVLTIDQATLHKLLALDPRASAEFLALLSRLLARRLREIDEKVIGWRILSGPGDEAATSGHQAG